MNDNLLVQALVILTLSLIGSLLNDYYDTLTNKDSEVKIARVLLGAITGAVIVFTLIEQFSYENERMIFLASFVFGIIGFKCFGWFKSLDINYFLTRFFNNIIDSLSKTKDNKLSGEDLDENKK